MNSEIVRTENQRFVGYGPDGSMRIETEDVRVATDQEPAIDIPQHLIARLGSTVIEEIDRLCLRLREQHRQPQRIFLSNNAAHVFLQHIIGSTSWREDRDSAAYELNSVHRRGTFRGMDLYTMPARENEPWAMRVVLHVLVTDGTDEGTEHVARHIRYEQFNGRNQFPRAGRIARGVSAVSIWLH